MTRLFNPAWAEARVDTHPYTWVYFAPGEFLTVAAEQELAHDFPMDGYQRRDRGARVTGKTYRNFSRPVAGPEGLADISDLAPLWRRMIEALLAPYYRVAMARLLGQSVAGSIELRLVRHGGGDWLAPHVDGADKLFSHLIYFTADWEESWGGRLELLATADPASAVRRITPRLGVSISLTRTDQAWHSVTAVKGGRPERRSLLIHGLVDGAGAGGGS
jgi:hypothetical protein